MFEEGNKKKSKYNENQISKRCFRTRIVDHMLRGARRKILECKTNGLSLMGYDEDLFLKTQISNDNKKLTIFFKHILLTKITFVLRTLERTNRVLKSYKPFRVFYTTN